MDLVLCDDFANSTDEIDRRGSPSSTLIQRVNLNITSHLHLENTPKENPCGIVRQCQLEVMEGALPVAPNQVEEIRSHQSDVTQGVSSRKGHKKSRQGCYNCKRRKIKVLNFLSKNLK